MTRLTKTGKEIRTIKRILKMQDTRRRSRSRYDLPRNSYKKRAKEKEKGCKSSHIKLIVKLLLYSFIL